jgi:hypothetical protein
MTITSTILLDAAHRAMRWLACQQTPLGNYRGIEPITPDGIYPDTDDVGCYYKSVYSLRVGGEDAAAARLMRHLVDRYMRPNGDVYTNEQSRSSGSYGPVFCQPYQNAWLARAAAAMRWYELGRKLTGFMITLRDPKTGGFRAHVDPSVGIIDSCATAVGALACLQHQRPELAVQTVDFLIDMFKAQKDPDKLYTRWTNSGGLLTDVSNVAEKNHLYCYIDRKKGKQAYWIWAWPMNVMIAVYEYTGDKKYLDAAIRIWEWLASAHENAFHFTTAGKGGWGSAMLFRITGEKRYLEKCLSQMDFILSTQQPAGWMLGPGTKDFAAQPLRTTYDFTADFTSWLVDSAMELAYMGM